ncbi:MAG: peptidoglycan DD-metalloendopeptidase family protein [Bacteroidales bacterium]|nr:peptidoglycan DD-metalloendopeptidase family protein [Bacteroidales bacterium]
MQKLEHLLSNYSFANVLPLKLSLNNAVAIDLSVNNKELYEIQELNSSSLTKYVEKKIREAGAEYGIGGYAEDRLVYRRSKHFGEGENARSIHLGVDIWCSANTPVFAPFDAIIHSFKNNDNFGDYGPTIILEHKIENTIFYTLYGHLSGEWLQKSKVKKSIKKGEKFAVLGTEDENGNWPPHLHFQIITDMQGRTGDFPGVASQKEKEEYLALCPNPNLILNT